MHRFKSALAVFLAALTIVSVAPQPLKSLLKATLLRSRHSRAHNFAAEARAENLNRIKLFLETVPGQEVLRQAGATSQKVETALPNLTDEELSDLAAKTQIVQSNFAAGHNFGDTINILLIVLIVVAIVAVIVAID